VGSGRYSETVLTCGTLHAHTRAMPRDHHFTIRGVRLLWRYTRLRGSAAGWAYMPDAKNPKMRPRVLIDEGLKGRERLETELHEALHHCFPDISEEGITEAARDCAKIIHGLGYRITTE